MKKKYMVQIIIFFIILIISILKANYTMAAEKTDYIIVGDSRTVGLHNSVTGDYSSSTESLRN